MTTTPEVQPRTPEQVQNEFEIGRAFLTAKQLEERLELAGLLELAHRARALRKELGYAFHGLFHRDPPIDA